MEKFTQPPIREKSYLRIVGTIMDMIAQGKVQYGDRLYNEQELVAMLGVSRPTLREALRVLEFLGVATVVPHKGITINRPSETGGYLPLLYILSFEKTTGKAVPYVIAGRRAGDVAEVYADPKKAKELLGWQAEKTIDDMCRDTWNWQKNNPNGYDE